MLRTQNARGGALKGTWQAQHRYRVGVVSGAVALLMAVVCQAIALPDRQRFDGTQLVLNGQGLRENLMINLYTVGLYVPKPTDSVSYIREPTTAKVFVLDIAYDVQEPTDLPENWREELIPPLSESQERVLRSAYKGIGRGDKVTIRYLPREGTSISVNDKVVLRDSGDKLMAAFIDLWLGAKPVSEKIKGSLLAGV